MPRTPHPSIRKRILLSLSACLLMTCVAAAYLTYHTACEEAAELFDYELKTVATSLPVDVAFASNAEKSGDYGGIADDGIVIQTWARMNPDAAVPPAPSAPSGNAMADRGPPRLSPGFHTVDFQHEQWRVYSIQQKNQYVQVAQPVQIRVAMGVHLAMRTVWPLILWLPISLAVILLIVESTFVPLRRLMQEIALRSYDALNPISIDRNVPEEVTPLFVSLNALLQRVQEATLAQRTFVADAAHELRTPLTALKLHVQSAMVAMADTRCTASTIEVMSGLVSGLDQRLNRTIHLAQQLLALAREDATTAHLGKGISPLDTPTSSLRHITERCLTDLSVLAERRDIALGFTLDPASEDDPHAVVGENLALYTALRNLIDNAIRYTPRGGTVDIALTRDTVRGCIDVSVVDNGCGVEEKDLPRLGNRFFRSLGRYEASPNSPNSPDAPDAASRTPSASSTPLDQTGSGLGLAIATRAIERHGAHLRLRNRADRRGFIAEIEGLRAVA